MPLSSKPEKVQSAAEDAKTPDFIAELRAQMQELAELMAQEMDLINARKLAEHDVLLKRKQRLTMDYRASLKTLAAQPDLLKRQPENIRLGLRAAAQKLADVAETNARQLRGVALATQRLIRNVIDLIKQEIMPDGAYKNLKTAHMELGTFSPTCKPVAVNRTA